MPTAAAIIIGNELLTGKFADENGPFLIRRLRALGCDLKRLVIVADDVGQIADEIRRCSAAFDFVMTTGGVGPTHDDVTLEAVAEAFREPLETRAELVALIDAFGLPKNDATLRMATIPRSTILLGNDALSYPVLAVSNVYVFPGVPRLFRAKFEVISARFAGARIHTARLYTDEWEIRIADRLRQIQDAHPAVEIGSYPRFGEGNYKVIVTMESRDEGLLKDAEAALSASLSVVTPGSATRTSDE